MSLLPLATEWPRLSPDAVKSMSVVESGRQGISGLLEVWLLGEGPDDTPEEDTSLQELADILLPMIELISDKLGFESEKVPESGSDGL